MANQDPTRPDAAPKLKLGPVELVELGLIGVGGWLGIAQGGAQDIGAKAEQIWNGPDITRESTPPPQSEADIIRAAEHTIAANQASHIAAEHAAQAGQNPDLP